MEHVVACKRKRERGWEERATGSKKRTDMERDKTGKGHEKKKVNCLV